MSADLILQLVEVAISLAQSQLNQKDAADTLLDIGRKAIQAYQDHTGQPLDPSLITSEAPL